MKPVATTWTQHERLARLAPHLVHPGHDHSFGNERLQSLVTDHLAGLRAPGCPAPG